MQHYDFADIECHRKYQRAKEFRLALVDDFVNRVVDDGVYAAAQDIGLKNFVHFLFPR